MSVQKPVPLQLARPPRQLRSAHSAAQLHRCGVVMILLIVALLLAGAGSLTSAAANAPARDQVTAAIDRLLSHRNLRDAVIGVEIRSVSARHALYGRNRHEALIVASNNKLVSTAAVLFHLGHDALLETGLYCRGTLTEGTLDGNLVVKGGGDPALCARFHDGDALEPLRVLAAGAQQAQITTVVGDLVLDDTVFDRGFVAPGWPADQLDYYYCAPVSGLSWQENVIDVKVEPGTTVGAAARLFIDPSSAPFIVEGRIKTGLRTKNPTIHLQRPGADGVIKVRGEMPLGSARWQGKVAVTTPPRYFGHMLRQILLQAGVEIRGNIVLAEAPIPVDSQEYRCLSRYTTPLRDLIIVVNKESHNNFAEHLFKLAGWKTEGQGSFAAGAAAVDKLFEDLVLEEVDPFTIVDGSGLSRGNRFSAHTLVSLLAAMYDSALRDTFIRSLPVAGMDGSLKKRMNEEPYRQQVRAKTGWIREVSALSGYIRAGSGEVYVFSILFNGYKGMNGEMKKVQDDICRVVVDLG